MVPAEADTRRRLPRLPPAPRKVLSLVIVLGVFHMEFHTLVSRVRAEFLEMPGLRLTLKQATRLWGMDDSVCRTVVDSLVEASFLRRAEGGTFVRAGQ